MGRAIYLCVLLAGLFPAAARASVITDRDIEYLGILNQQGTQIIVDILQSEDGLNGAHGDHPNISSTYCYEKLRHVMGLLTQDGDHLQSVVVVARRMVDPKDEEIVRRFAKLIAEATARRIPLFRNDVNSITETCTDDGVIYVKMKQVLSFLDDFANVAGSIAGRAK
jgi:hypothetical protein